MTELSASALALITLGTIFVGVSVGLLTGNPPFAFLMLAFPVAALFVLLIFVPTVNATMPARGSSTIALPLGALIAGCVGASVICIAVGHASRYLIRTRGGEGEKIALAALIVGYSMLALESTILLWLVTFFVQLTSA